MACDARDREDGFNAELAEGAEFFGLLGVFPEASLRAPRFGKENRNAEMEDARGARVVVRRRGSRLGFCSAADRDRVLRATHLYRSTGQEGCARGLLCKPHGGILREAWKDVLG